MKFNTLHPLHEGDFFFAWEFVVFLPDFLIATGLVDSKNNVRKLIANKVRVTLLTHHLHDATFDKMQIIKPWNHFAFCEGEQIMLANNILKIRTIKPEYACNWNTKAYE